MHYAIVTETYPPEINGVALTVRGLQSGLRKRGHQVSLVRPRQPGESPASAGQPDKQCSVEDELLVRSVPLPRYPGLRLGLPATWQLMARWRAAPPDAIYVATEGPLGWSAVRAGRRLGIPVATGLHTRFDQYMRDYGAAMLARPALAWMRRFHNRADATLVPTTELLDLLATQGFQRVARLSRAVDTQLFAPARRDRWIRAQWGLGDDDLAVIHVGRIAPEKNLDLAVHAFRALQRIRPRSRFIWVGDGPARDSLQREHPDFIFCGVQRDQALAQRFASADMFLFPSRSETFGNVTLEAMASGVPVVAFNYGAAGEYLRSGVHGAAVDTDNAFIAAAVGIACDDVGRAAMAVAARSATARLRPEQVATDFDALLEDLVRRPETRVGGAHPLGPRSRPDGAT